MNKWRCIGVIAIVMAFCFVCSKSSYSGALEHSGTEKERIAQQYEALESINRIRVSMGLQAFVMDDSLKAMAESHCRYMNAVKSVSFEEVADNEFYTGAYPLDRGVYFEYNKDYISEYNQQRMASYSKCVEWCIQDPYQRTQLLSPEYTDIGFGKDGNYYSIEIGGNGYTGDSLLLMYPYAGQQAVDNLTMAELKTIPESLDLNESQSIGIPITIQYYNAGFWELSFKNIRAELVDTKKGERIELIAIAPQDEDSIRNTLVLFPTERYQANTGYTVSVRFDVWYKDVMLESIDEKWAFKSAGPDFMGEVDRKNAIISLAEALQIPVGEIEEPDILFEYNDVKQNQEEYALLYKLKQDGVLSTNERVFQPQEFTTREQAVVWLMDMLKIYAPGMLERVELNYKDTYADINKCSTNAMDAVQMAYQLGFIEDQGQGIFNPKVMITKAEMDELTEKVKKTVRISWPEPESITENESDEDK